MIRALIIGSASIDFELDKQDNYIQPFLQTLARQDIQPVSELPFDAIIAINHNSKSLRKALVSFGRKDPCVLIRTEPDSVFPAQYTQRVEGKYNFVFTIGRPKVESDKFLNFPHPYWIEENPNTPNYAGLDKKGLFINVENFRLEDWLKRSIFVSLVAANKVSSTKTNNYKLRRDMATTAKLGSLEVFGGLWRDKFITKAKHRLGVLLHAIRNRTVPNFSSIWGGLFIVTSNYKGSPANKQDIISKSKYSLVIENSNSYVSEKIFDAMVGGSIPIYFGPQLSLFGIDEKDLLIRHDGNFEDLHSMLKNISIEEVSRRLSTIHSFLVSKYFQDTWLMPNVNGRIAECIHDCLTSVLANNSK